MAKVFANVPGAAFRIDKYGDCTETTPAEVPDDVARRLEAEMAGEPRDPKVRGHVGRAPNPYLRIEYPPATASLPQAEGAEPESTPAKASSKKKE